MPDRDDGKKRRRPTIDDSIQAGPFTIRGIWGWIRDVILSGASEEIHIFLVGPTDTGKSWFRAAAINRSVELIEEIELTIGQIERPHVYSPSGYVRDSVQIIFHDIGGQDIGWLKESMQGFPDPVAVLFFLDYRAEQFGWTNKYLAKFYKFLDTYPDFNQRIQVFVPVVSKVDEINELIHRDPNAHKREVVKEFRNTLVKAYVTKLKFIRRKIGEDKYYSTIQYTSATSRKDIDKILNIVVNKFTN